MEANSFDRNLPPESGQRPPESGTSALNLPTTPAISHHASSNKPAGGNGTDPLKDQVTNMAPPAEEAWRLARKLFELDHVVRLQVVDANKGGLMVIWNGLPGFVPASQLLDFPFVHLETERLQELQRRCNQYLRLKIIELEPSQRRFIWSERAALTPVTERERLLRQLAPGDTVTGQVTSLAAFGVFVDLGGAEGLIHISELSWRRVNHPRDIVQPGDAITVQVLSVNADAGRIALSLKRLYPDPWLGVQERYQPGQLIRGVVCNIVVFGAFVLLEEGLEGLLHISELGEGAVTHPGQLIKEGDELLVRVLQVDGGARRLALSLRQVDEET
jgi:small subunit ribosomal protein S1